MQIYVNLLTSLFIQSISDKNCCDCCRFLHFSWASAFFFFLIGRLWCVCVCVCVCRKREEEQRRREAEQQNSLASAEQRKMLPERVEHQRHSLANKMNGLALHDPAVEPRKSSKVERLKAKEELRKQKGNSHGADSMENRIEYKTSLSAKNFFGLVQQK